MALRFGWSCAHLGLAPYKLLPSARHERRVGAFLVRAARERRPEGPAYLLSFVMLLYLAGQCAFFCTHIPHLDQRNSEGFSRVPADGFFLFLNFRFRI